MRTHRFTFSSISTNGFEAGSIGSGTTFACSLGSVEPHPASIFAELFWQRPVGIAVVEHVERPVDATDLAEPVVERVWLDLAAICGRHFVGLFEKRRVEPVAVEHAD